LDCVGVALGVVLGVALGVVLARGSCRSEASFFSGVGRAREARGKEQGAIGKEKEKEIGDSEM
jgi:hypothetical protein